MFTESEEIAKKEILDEAREDKLPVDKGYFNHEVNLVEVPHDLMVYHTQDHSSPTT